MMADVMKQACDCRDWSCGLPPCDGCGEDHGGLEFGDKRLCRDCHLAAMWKRIEECEIRDPGSLDRRLAEVTEMLRDKPTRHRRHEGAVMKYLSPKDIADRFGISRAHAYRLIAGMRTVRLGDCVRVAERDLETYLSKHERKPWDNSTDVTLPETGTATTPPLKDDESREASAPRTSRSRKNASDLPSWAQRPIREAKKSG